MLARLPSAGGYALVAFERPSGAVREVRWFASGVERARVRFIDLEMESSGVRFPRVVEFWQREPDVSSSTITVEHRTLSPSTPHANVRRKADELTDFARSRLDEGPISALPVGLIYIGAFAVDREFQRPSQNPRDLVVALDAVVNLTRTSSWCSTLSFSKERVYAVQPRCLVRLEMCAVGSSKSHA